ncbi:thiamine phosphate synthase [soil metagenome]
MSAGDLRVVLITDRTLVPDDADLVARITAIAAAVPRGSIAVHVREKDLEGAALLARVRAVVATRVPVWVNDRLDVARVAGAYGVHLPEQGLALEDARTIAAGLALGCSRHSAAAALEANADLVQLGPVFATPGKRPIGLEPFHVVRASLAPEVTLVAVGGIDSGEAASLAAAAGADAVAVIRAAWIGTDPVATIAALIAGVDDGRASRHAR